MNSLISFLGEQGSIRRRVMYLVMGASAIITVIAFWGYNKNREYLTNISDLNTIRQLFIELDHMVNDTYEIRLLLVYGITGNDVSSQISEMIAEQKSHLVTLQEGIRLFDRHVQEHSEHVHMIWNSVSEIFKSFEAEMNHVQSFSAQEIPVGTLQSLHITSQRYSSSLQEMNELLESLADVHSDFMKQNFENTIWGIGIFLVAVIPVLVFLAFVITKLVTSSLTHLHENISALVSGEGDLNALLPEESGEAGEVAHLYNQLIIKLRVSLLQVLEVASLLGSASRQLQTNAEQTRVGLVGQEAEVKDVISSMQHLESEINSIGDITKIAADVSSQAQSMTSSGQALMGKTVGVIRKLNDDSVESSAKIERVVESANYIGTVTSVINDIAEQTNLLALNAAIEAARAGEQGRGFAVVADEVRKLASRTQNSVGEINTIIEELKSNISTAQKAMLDNQESANVAQESINEMSSSLREIGDSNNRIADMNQEIVDAVTRQMELASSINRNTVNLQSTTKQAESNAFSMESLSEKLTELVARLDITAETFNLQDHLDPAERELINAKYVSHASSSNTNTREDDVELF